jgi:simple sugar transport system ATP-binding protein
MPSDGPRSPWAVELRGVTKAFGSLAANRDLSFRVARGALHALVGENGAGKSTCMKLLYGLEKPDAGEILVHGRQRRWRSPRDAAAAGLGMVHQHFMLAEPLSGLDNIILGAEPGPPSRPWLRGPLAPIDRGSARRRLAELARAYRLDVPLDSPAGALPVGVQQRLEILKLLYRDADILILDEPTAVLTPQEVTGLFGNLRRLTAEGKTVLVITHKLGEVRRFADHVTVLRRGQVVGDQPVTPALTEAALAAQMVGRAVTLTAAPPPPPVLGAPALELERVTLRHKSDRPRLGGIDLSVAGGEIVAIAGVEGNGQSDLLGVILDPAAYGRRRGLAMSGRVKLFGASATSLSPRAIRDRGVGVVPEDRHRQGLLLGESLTGNFLLGLQRRPEFRRYGLIRAHNLLATFKRAIAAFDIRPPAPAALARSLSGGNQQKLIIARELERAPRLLICAQPTRGVDVGSIELIHGRILAARAAGMAVLLVSSELDEITALADRIAVIEGGRIAATFGRGEADQETFGRFMGGGGSHG